MYDVSHLVMKECRDEEEEGGDGGVEGGGKNVHIQEREKNVWNS